MRYFRVFWKDLFGEEHRSEPLHSFADAHAYAEQVGETAEIVRY